MIAKLLSLFFAPKAEELTSTDILRALSKHVAELTPAEVIAKFEAR